MFKFDGEAWCIIFCRANSDVVQMTSNLASEEVAVHMANSIKANEGYVFRVAQIKVLIAALELIKGHGHRTKEPR